MSLRGLPARLGSVPWRAGGEAWRRTIPTGWYAGQSVGRHVLGSTWHPAGAVGRRLDGLRTIGARRAGWPVAYVTAAGVPDRVVGIAGGPEKCALLTDELGFDAAIDYRADDVRKALHRHTLDGIDVYFDNVGGDILDAALTRPAMHARVVVCGAISRYNNATPVKGPSSYLTPLVRRARMGGIVVFDHAKRCPQAAQDISAWIADGRIKVREHVVRGGVDDFPETLQMLFRGENVGKLVLEPA
ncbi:zinc-binding dehydrogenase [Streptomyces sp. AHU1]|uniref:zinc-binding dehydrogenase n=1 Tax=Streptomyces sp. AHU1 TaxID=3377215 RepID=UPI003877FB73